MILSLRINNETFVITKPVADDKNLTFYDLYACFYKLLRESGYCTDEIDAFYGNLSKEVDAYLKGEIEMEDGFNIGDDE